MKNLKLSATHTSEKKSHQDQILDKLFDYFSTPQGEKPRSDSDVEVSFYRSSLNKIPRNYFNTPYSGVNIIMLLMAQREHSHKVPIYSTFKQAATLLEQHKALLPAKSEHFDPDRPLKGVKLDTQVVKYLESYKKGRELLSKSQFEQETKGMSFSEMRKNGFQKRKGLKLYNVFAIEQIKHLLPQVFLDDRPYFAEQEILENKEMSSEQQDIDFVEKAQFIIEAMDIAVVESYEDRAYYSPKKHQIVIPPRHKFLSDKAYFAVILHELSHSTSRHLKRDMSSIFGTTSYAKEELIAECATLFMCMEEGLESFHAHAQYLEGWASHFSDKKKALLSVCKQAKDAQQYISDKVAEHRLKLANQPKYTPPIRFDTALNLNDQSRDRLTSFIDNEANRLGSFISLKHQKLLGFNNIKQGIEVFTDKKSIRLYGAAAHTLKRQVEKLEVLQDLFVETPPKATPFEPKNIKPKPSQDLSI